MTKPKRDHAGCVILAIVGSCCAIFLLGLGVEILKFVALIKWIFS